VLKRLANERNGDPTKNPFVVKLWWSFHDADNLYLILDFHPGGDLATQLSRWGRLGRDRARFYTSEIVEGVECLHAAGVIYRDLKPENALLGADGHIVLVDFGLAAEFPNSRGPLAVTPHWMGESPMDNETIPRLHRHATAERDTLMPTRDLATSFVGTAEYLVSFLLLGNRC
jgi:serine/threonine protein kinase